MDVYVIKPILFMKVNNNSSITALLTFNSFSLQAPLVRRHFSPGRPNTLNNIYDICMLVGFMV